MKKIFSIVFLFINSSSFAQLENANWCFAHNARVDFNIVPPVPSACTPHHTGSLAYGGNSVSVSNKNGDLLFYSDGITVWDRSHNIMLNGNNIGGGTEGVLDNKQQ